MFGPVKKGINTGSRLALDLLGETPPAFSQFPQGITDFAIIVGIDGFLSGKLTGLGIETVQVLLLGKDSVIDFASLPEFLPGGHDLVLEPFDLSLEGGKALLHTVVGILHTGHGDGDLLEFRHDELVLLEPVIVDLLEGKLLAVLVLGDPGSLLEKLEEIATGSHFEIGVVIDRGKDPVAHLDHDAGPSSFNLVLIDKRQGFVLGLQKECVLAFLD